MELTKEIINRLPIEDKQFCGIVYEQSDLNKLIQNKYLSSSGNTELKTRLFRILSHLPALQIGLVVSYKGNTSKVAQIALKCVFDEERVEKDKIPLIEEEVNSYFKDIGFKTTNAINYSEMVDLINRLAEDVPQVKEYFQYEELL